MPEKSVIIIGAGLTGLSAGCYGRMNNYSTLILEKHNKPGGLCTTWERQGYSISTTQFIVGSSPGRPFHRIWEELGAVQDQEFIDYDYFLVVEGTGGGTFFVHTDLDKLEQHMKELAPEDGKLIDVFLKGARTITRYELPIFKAPELQGPGDKIRLMASSFPLIRTIMKWKKVPVPVFASRFRNQNMREAFSQLVTMYSADLPVAIRMMALAVMHMRSAGYPVGGSLKFARSVERRYIGLGGEIRYNSPVSKILAKRGRAYGVRLEDGTEHYADYVISAADGHTTIFRMLDGMFVSGKIRKYYDKWPLFPDTLMVSLGVAMPFEEMPRSGWGITLPLKEPVSIAGKEHRNLVFNPVNFDETAAPAGKTLFKAFLSTEYELWNALRPDKQRYAAEKEKVADAVTALMNDRFPGLAGRVEMRDVATPMTFERYTGNWKGNTLGWGCTTRTFFVQMPKTLPGLKNFYMAGQWVEPGGGLPSVAVSGRNVIQLLCKQDKKEFETTIP